MDAVKPMEVETQAPRDVLLDLVAIMVRAVVNTPGGVDVSANPTEAGSTMITVTVADGELGQAIGQQGKLANSVRNIVKASAMREKRKVYVEIVGRAA